MYIVQVTTNYGNGSRNHSINKMYKTESGALKALKKLMNKDDEYIVSCKLFKEITFGEQLSFCHTTLEY
jgi:hypothetical protein